MEPKRFYNSMLFSIICGQFKRWNRIFLKIMIYSKNSLILFNINQLNYNSVDQNIWFSLNQDYLYRFGKRFVLIWLIGAFSRNFGQKTGQKYWLKIFWNFYEFVCCLRRNKNYFSTKFLKIYYYLFVDNFWLIFCNIFKWNSEGVAEIIRDNTKRKGIF